MESDNREVNLMNCIQLACVLIGTIIGGGFAMGRQTVNFFTRFGWTTWFFPAVAVLLIGICYYNAWNFARLTGTYDFKQYAINLYKPFNNILLPVADFMFIYSSFVAVGAAVAGGGSVISSLTRLPNILSCFIFAGMVVLASMFGAAFFRRFSFSLSVVISITLGSIAIVGFGIRGNQIMKIFNNRIIMDGESYGSALWQAILFSAAMCNYAPIVAVSDKMKTKKEILITAIIGASALGLITTMISVLSTGWLPEIITVPIPNLFITQEIEMPWVYSFYIVALCAAYITTGSAFCFAISKRFENSIIFKNVKKGSFFDVNPARRFNMVAIFYTFLCAVVSMLGVMVIVNKGMVLMGYFFLPVVLIPHFTVVPYKCRQIQKARMAEQIVKQEE